MKKTSNLQAKRPTILKIYDDRVTKYWIRFILFELIYSCSKKKYMKG